MEASRARLSESQRLSRSTAVIIRETRVTIERALGILDPGPPYAPDRRQKRLLNQRYSPYRRSVPTVC